MGRQRNTNVPEDGYISKKQFNDTGSIAASDFAVVADLDNTTKIVFDPSGQTAGKTLTIAAGANTNNITLTLPTTSGTISTSTFTSPLTTKGDVHTYSTTDARLAVGTNGQALTADSTQTTGLKWSTISATPGGSNTQIQFNDSSAFAGDSTFKWDKTKHSLTAGSANFSGLGNNAFAQGTGSTASGNQSVGLNGSSATAIQSCAVNGSTCQEFLAFSANSGHCFAGSNTSTALNHANCYGQSSLALGEGTETHAFAQVTMGQFNVNQGTSTSAWTASDDILIIGNGVDSGTTHNALSVTGNGLLKLHGTTSGSVGIQSPATATTHVLTLPSAQGTANTVLTNNGSGSLSWANGLPSITNVSTQFDKTNTTLANVTGLTATLVAGGTYSFSSVLFVDADVVGGQKYAIGGTATATSIIYNINALSNATNAYVVSSRQTAIGGSAGQAGSTGNYTEINGTIVVNAGGTLTIQFAQNAANGTSSVLVGSSFQVSRIS